MTTDPTHAVFMACSATKKVHLKLGGHKPGETPMAPAGMVYDGTPWRTLRSNVAWCQRNTVRSPWVCFLSAKHGFQWEGHSIALYDDALTSYRAEQLLADPEAIKRLRWLMQTIRRLHVTGGDLYRHTVRRGLDLIGFDGTIEEASNARGIGDQLAALRAFVRAGP